MKMRKQCLSFFLSFWFMLLYGQQKEHYIIPDSLLEKTYDELRYEYNIVKFDTVIAQLYAKTYLKKGLLDKDIIRQADAYYFLSFPNRGGISIKYADSIILLTKDIKDYNYPARGFLVKAINLRRMGKKEEGLDQTLKAYEYAVANNNDLQQLELKYQIGVAKNSLEDEEEALNLFRIYLKEAKKNMKKVGSMHTLIARVFTHWEMPIIGTINMIRQI